MVATLAGLIAAAVVGAVLVTLALLRPTSILIITVFLDATNINLAFATDTGISLFRPLLGLSALAIFVLWRQNKLRFGWSPILTALLILYAAWLITITISVDPTTSTTLFTDYATALVYFVLVYVLLVSLGSWRQVMYAVVGGLAALAALTLFHQFVLHNAGNLYNLSNVPLVQEDGAYTARHSGTELDVNFWARTLVLMVPFGLMLWAISKKFFKLFWLGATFALLGGVFLTQSRGAFLAIVPVIVLWFCFAGRRYRRYLAYFPVLFAIAIPVSGVGSRLGTLLQLGSSSNQAAQDQSLITRIRFQKAALHMFLDSPVFGHGMGTYGVLFPKYDRYSDLGDPVTITVAAHNFYLEQAADGGILLLTAWAIFFGTIFFLAWRIWNRARDLGRPFEQQLGVAIATGLLGWLAASAFLHLSDWRIMLLVAAVTASVDLRLKWAQQERASGPASEVPVAEEKLPVEGDIDLRQVLTRLAVPIALVLAVVGAVVVSKAAPTTWTAQEELRASVVTDSSDGMTSYQADLITRGQLVPSFAAMGQTRDFKSVVTKAAGVSTAQADKVTLSVAVSRQGGGIDVTVSAPDQLVAQNVAVAAGEVLAQRVSTLRSPYYLQQPRHPDAVGSHPSLLTGIGMLAAAVILPILAYVFRRKPEEEDLEALLAGEGPMTFDRMRALSKV